MEVDRFEAAVKLEEKKAVNNNKIKEIQSTINSLKAYDKSDDVIFALTPITPVIMRHAPNGIIRLNALIKLYEDTISVLERDNIKLDKEFAEI